MFTPKEEKRLYELSRTLLDNLQGKPEAIANNLIEIIRYADWKYYVMDNPVISDSEYDILFKKLKHLEELHPELKNADSPTQRIAQGISERFPSVSHLVPMLSLDNTYNAEDLTDWDKRCKEFSGKVDIEYCVEPKYDGASISLIFENDKLARGATRGDGVAGEEITTNIRQIMAIPLKADFSKYGINQIEIRGESVIHKNIFSEFNKQRINEGLAPLANPRNAASGTLRMLDSTEVRKRKLSAVLYHISYHNFGENAGEELVNTTKAEQLATHYNSLKWLHSLGFPTPVNEMKLFTNIADVIQFCHEFEKRRDSLPYEVDGLVIKVNDFALQEKMGMTSHHPRWAVAYKFKARQATSVLRKVEFQVGRTGVVTPVAKIDAVPIGGVIVSSISLFNEDILREKDIRIGDTVLVERAGDVIPYIVKSFPDLRTGEEVVIKFPVACPACGSQLEKQDDLAAWRCTNNKCPVQVAEKLMHFASKDAMDIKSLGSANIQKFFDLGLLKDIPNFYDLDWSKIKRLEGFGDKSVQNLKDAIEKSKSQPLYRLIFGLGIRYVGETTAKTLANAVSHIRDLYEMDTEKLCALEDVGPKVAQSVFSFLQNAENKQIIDRLETFGVNLANTKKQLSPVVGNLAGKTFLFTGTLVKYKRSDAETLVAEKGGTILGGVSSKLNYLVVGLEAGSKLEKAKKLGTISILTEDEFITLIENS